jgi:nucleoside-diphosphate-sugar epimerase
MRVFVTGATGYVGGPLVDELLSCGHEVAALVRDRERARRLLHPDVTLVDGDVRRVAGLMPAETDVVVHLAASLFPVSDRSVNVGGTLAVLAEARRVSVHRFIYMSSALVYGPNPPDVAVPESHPCRPNMRFARQQLEAEQAILTVADTEGFPAVVLRPSQIFGGEGGSFAALVDRIKTGSMMVGRTHGQNVSLTELSDLIDATLACMGAPLAPGEIFNVTSGQLPVPDLFVRIANGLKVKPPPAIPPVAILAAGALAGASAYLTRRPPTFNLDVAKVALFSGGPRVTDKAREMLNFAPRHRDPMHAVAAHYLRSGASSSVNA